LTSPLCRAYSPAATTPAAGPDSIMRTGIALAVMPGTMPPLDAPATPERILDAIARHRDPRVP